VNRGIAAYNRGDWPAAYRLAQKQLDDSKNDPIALRLLARATARVGAFSQARAIYGRLGPLRLEAEDHCLMGMIWMVEGQPVAAEEALHRALNADPRHTESLYQLGLAAYQLRRVFECTRAAEQLALRPGWEARADFLLGMIRASDHDPAGAAAALQRALKIDPAIRAMPKDPSSTKRLLARVLLQAGRPEEACETLGQVLESGADREAEWLLSRAYLQRGNLAAAAAALERSSSYRTEHSLEPAPYVGEARCAICHREVADLARASRHAHTFRGGKDLADMRLPDRPLTEPENPHVSHSLRMIDGRVRVETRVADTILRAVVDYALGSNDRFTSLIGHDEQGHARTLRLSYYHSAEGSGWTRSKNHAPRPRRDDEYLGELFASDDEQRGCLVCHTTNERVKREQSGPAAADKAIGCERCHGPGGHHIAAIAAKFPDTAIGGLSRASPAEINQSCAECHAQHFLPMPAERTAPGWARFPSSTLSLSRCYVESGGNLACTACHDPHRNAEITPAHYEAKCLSCHAKSRNEAAPGTLARGAANPEGPSQGASAYRSSCPVNPSTGCLKCHMPKVPYDWLRGSFTDHYIRIHSPSQAGS
jgi:hypothetical protein